MCVTTVQNTFGLVTCFIDHLDTHHYTLQIADTQTSVLNLLQSPLAVSWQQILTQFSLHIQNFQLGPLATKTLPFNTNLTVN
jgi:hypothetical protein